MGAENGGGASAGNPKGDDGRYGTNYGERGNSMGGSSTKATAAPYGYNAQGQPVSKAERDNWNRLKRESGMSSAELYASKTSVDPFAAMMSMMAGGAHTPSGPDYEAQRLQQLEDQGIKDRDDLYLDYMTAAGSATDYVNTQIESERSNAQLLGIDFNLTDEDKSTRISDYFATIWGEGEQTRLEDLFAKWGNPEGFTDWTVKRGSGTVSEASDTSGTTSAKTYKSGGSTTSLLDEEPTAATTILGG